jgi:hypothetical protein
MLFCMKTFHGPHKLEQPLNINNNNTNSSVALVRERTIPTERPSCVGEVSASLKGILLRKFIRLSSLTVNENVSSARCYRSLLGNVVTAGA